MSNRTFAYIMAVLYFVLVGLFVSATPVWLALGTGAMWWAAMNLADLALRMEEFDSMFEAVFYLRTGVRL